MSDKLFALRIPLHGGARLAVTAYDANHTDPQTGHMRIDVRAVLHTPDPRCPMRAHVRRVIFKRGETYCAVNRWTAIDSDDAKELVLSLLAMKPGDTDSEYFEHYTPEQLEFAERFGEEIAMIAMDRFGEQ